MSGVSSRITSVAFDVLETLLNLDPLRERLRQVEQPEALLDPWFLRFQRDAMALTLSGDVGAFEPVARQALRTETHHTISEEGIDHVLAGFAEMPAFPDAAPALAKLVDAGVTVGCLTVGGVENTRRFLANAGLAPYIEHVVTAEMAGAWKPAPAIYQHTAEVMRTPIDRMGLVAVHAWDCHGAKRAGAWAGWCSRLEGEPGDVFWPADVTGDDLVEVADGLLGAGQRTP